ncbi:MAG: GGDEF domain-containing protein [Hyphomicrobiales bacterium]
MRKLADTAYWIFAAGTVGSLSLAAFVFVRLQPEILSQNAPSIGPFNPLFFTLIVMGLTLAFGLFFTMPILRKRNREQELLTDRAAELEVAVVTDPLTKLYNRRYFEDALEEYVSEFAKIGAPLALLTLDLDHFKSVNDTYGHDAGDVVLKQLSANLQKVTREHDIVARTGGEEFCIVAPFSESSQIRPFAERVCRMVEQMRVDIGVIILRPTISIGVASTADGPKTSKELLKISDERLYQAKEQGRNRVCC